MENTADELTDFYLSILDYGRKFLMLSRCEETEEPAAPREKPLTIWQKLFLPVEEACSDKRGSSRGPSAANRLCRLPR